MRSTMNASPSRQRPRRSRPLPYPDNRLVKGGLSRLHEELAAARAELEATRTSAQRDAARIRLRAERDARRIQRAAYREGLRAGAAAIADWQARLEDFLATRAAALPAEAAALALRGARRILDVEFELRPTAVCDHLRTALADAQFCRDIVIVIAAEDYAVLAPLLRGDLPEDLAVCRHVRWLPQENAPRGTLRIVSHRGLVDASIDQQLLQLEEALAAAVPPPAPTEADR